MKILIAEDRAEKRDAIYRVLNRYEKSEISTAKTYFSARSKILKNNNYDLIIVDMFLPDAKDKEELYGLAGKDLIFDMQNEEISIPVLVITQYTEYCNVNGEKKNSGAPGFHMLENTHYGQTLEASSPAQNDCTHYNGLHKYLSQEIPFYLGIIFYNTQSSDWEEELIYFLNKLNTRR